MAETYFEKRIEEDPRVRGLWIFILIDAPADTWWMGDEYPVYARLCDSSGRGISM